MYRLDLEKAEGLEIKLSTSVGSQRKKGNFKKKSSDASQMRLKPLTVWITQTVKILEKMEIPDHFICLLRNLYAGQEATVRTRHETTDQLKIGKAVGQGCGPCDQIGQFSVILVFIFLPSAYKLNKQGDSIQPCPTAFPIFN